MAHDKPHQKPMEADAESTSQQRGRMLLTHLKSHVAHIILLCSLVAIPMIACTVALLGFIFVNVTNDITCLHPELCPGPDLINATSRHFYYIDFPAARLALISSLSSSVSLALVGALMAMYAYIEARRIISYSRATHASEQYAFLNPYQFSILIRVLNADLLALWELGYGKIKSVFWRRDRSESRKVKDEPRNVLRTSIGVFVFCILGRYVYFHNTTCSACMIASDIADSNQYTHPGGRHLLSHRCRVSEPCANKFFAEFGPSL